MANGLKPYHLKPPSWREPWLARDELGVSGFPQFFPTRAGQEEDCMSEAAIKSGYSSRVVVPSNMEFFSAHTLLHDKLAAGDLQSTIKGLTDKIRRAQAANTETAGPSQFRLPSRVTLNEQKREAWINELADDAVSLAKLSRTIPHGYRGEKLLEMICNRRVSHDRALWYIRAIGASDINASRNRPNFSVASYTREWTKIVTDFLDRELARRVSFSSTTDKKEGKQPARHDIDDGLRHLLSLVEDMWSEDLLDQTAYLGWLAKRLGSCALPILPLISFLVEARLRDLCESSVSSACLVKSALTRYNELGRLLPNNDVYEAQTAVGQVIDALFVCHPHLADSFLFQSGDLGEIDMTLKHRFPVLSKVPLPFSNTSTDAHKEADAIEFIKLLDGVRFPMTLAAAHDLIFVAPRSRTKLSWIDQLQLMFDWATTLERMGSYRRYVVAGLIKREATRAKRDVAVETVFIDWLDRGVLASNRKQARLLLTELIRRRVIDRGAYTQRLIARGETERSNSAHIDLLGSIPLFNERCPLTEDTRDLEEKLLACLAYASSELEHDLTDLFHALDAIQGTNRVPVVTRHFVQSWLASLADGQSLTLDHHVILTEVFTRLDDYAGYLDYVIAVLNAHPSTSLLPTLLDSIEFELDTFNGLECIESLADALYAAYDQQKRLGLPNRRLLMLLSRFDSLSAEMKLVVTSDHTALVNSLSTAPSDAGLLLAAPVELQVLRSPHIDVSLPQLATRLWYRYHVHSNWVTTILDTILSCLTESNLGICCQLLREVGERTATGLGQQLSTWLTKKPTATLQSLMSDLHVSLYIQLVLNRTIRAWDAIAFIVKPAWVLCAQALVDRPTSEIWTAIDRIVNLFELLTCHDRQVADSAPCSILDTRLRHESRLRKGILLATPPIDHYAQCLALLSIVQEMAASQDRPTEARRFETLFLQISEDPSCAAAITRYTEPFCAAFLELSSLPTSTFYHMHSKVLAALVFLLKDGKDSPPTRLVSTEDWDVFLSRLTIWRLDISKMEVLANLVRLDLDQSLSDAQRTDALKLLSNHFIDRVCSGEGQTFLGEQVIKCYRGPAAGIFVSLAFERVSSALPNLASPGLASRKARQTLRSITRLLSTLLFSNTVKSEDGALVDLLDSLQAAFSQLEQGTLKVDDAATDCLVQMLRLALLSTKDSDGSKILEQLGAIVTSAVTLAVRDASETFLNVAEDCMTALVAFGAETMPTLDVVLTADMPLAIVDRICSIFTFMPAAAANPWELLEVAIPATKELQNSGPVDLLTVHARVVEPVPPVTALDAPIISVPPPPIDKGVQTNFDFETPCTTLSLPARHHRRTMQGIRLPVRALLKASQPAAGPSEAAKENDKKREIIVISDEDEATPATTKKAKPAPKRAAKRKTSK